MIRVQKLLLFAAVVHILLIAGSMSFLWLQSSHHQQVVFLNRATLLEKFHGTIEGEQLLQNRISKWQSNLDSMALQIDQHIASYKRNATTMSEAERSSAEQFIQQRQEDFFKLQASLSDARQAEEDRINQGIRNQLNSQIEAYAQKHNIGLIIGTEGEGNVLFGNDMLDITDEILTEMNAPISMR